MCTDKADIHLLIDKKDNSNDSIIIAFYIKHVAVIANIVHCIERLLNVRKIAPIRLRNGLVPVFQRLFCICMNSDKITYGCK